MSQNSPKPRNQNPVIAVVLILLVCFLSGAESLLIPPQKEEPVTTVVATVSPEIAPTPSPTPFPTQKPKQLMGSDTPQDPYPELYGDNPTQEFAPPKENVVYLTFDDGPSTSTPALLEVLKQEGVPATFFIHEDDFPEILKQIFEDGHTLGIHTHSHIYEYVYWNKSAFLADFSRCFHNIRNATGYTPRIFRFPGGSVNSYNRHLIWELVTEMEQRGFVYYDWNVTSEDASTAKTCEQQLENLMTQSEKKNRIIALMHDTGKNPWIAQVVENYIHHMKDRGFTFASLDSSVQPIHFPMP